MCYGNIVTVYQTQTLTNCYEMDEFRLSLFYRLSSRPRWFEIRKRFDSQDRLSSRPRWFEIRKRFDSKFGDEGLSFFLEPAIDWSSGCHHLAVAWSDMAIALNTHVLLDVKQPWNHWFITGPGSTPRQLGQTCGTWCFSWKFWLVDQKIKSMTLLRKYGVQSLHRNMHSVIA